jgi:hypothetical protein
MRTEIISEYSYKNVLSIINKLPEKEKDKLFFSLKNERLKALLIRLRKSMKHFPFSFEEITSEVEKARAKRYANKRGK